MDELGITELISKANSGIHEEFIINSFTAYLAAYKVKKSLKQMVSCFKILKNGAVRRWKKDQTFGNLLMIKQMKTCIEYYSEDLRLCKTQIKEYKNFINFPDLDKLISEPTEEDEEDE